MVAGRGVNAAYTQAVGSTAVYLIGDAGVCTTGEIIHVDGGFHVMGMPRVENI
jgi:enoyl-[acyl-carrier protein] reductase I